MKVVDQFIIDNIMSYWKYMDGLERSILVVGAVVLLAGFIYILWVSIYVKIKYGKAIMIEGEVVNMDYTSSRTSQVGKTTIYHSSRHEIHILDEFGNKWRYDNEELYQTVRLDDTVVIEYQKKYKGLKDMDLSEYKDIGRRTLSVQSPKGRTVSFNRKEEVEIFRQLL